MNVKPVNRHLLVELSENTAEENEPTILLPEDYKKPEQPYVIVDVISASVECGQKVKSDWKKLLVPRNMIIEAEYNGQPIYLIQENYVLAIMS